MARNCTPLNCVIVGMREPGLSEQGYAPEFEAARSSNR